MGQLLILLAVALVAAALAWGVAVLLLGRDQGLDPAEPDGRAIPLPTARPLTEADFGTLRFDTTVRGYRMAQVDQAVRRAAYDVGYKEELIGVLEAEEPLAAPAAPADREPDDAVDDDAGTARAVDGGDAEDDVDAEAPGSAATVDGWVASGARTGKPAGDGAADAEK